MSDLEGTRKLEKNELPNVALGENPDLQAEDENELGKFTENDRQLSDEELNKPIDGPQTVVKASLDCRSECQYNTGERYKYANYGYSG